MLFKRKDGVPLDDKLSIGRRFMPYVLGGATESWVLWEEIVKIQPALDFIEKWNKEHPPEMKLTMNTFVLRACALAAAKYPRMNKFLAGKRYYQRNGIDISFSAKKEKTDKAGLLIFKRRFTAEESLEDVVRDIRSMIERDRSQKISEQEKETFDLMRIPRLILMLAMKGVFLLDFFNLLPHSFIEGNPMFASMFISNLGSIGMNSGWHHLYHFGNIPLFGVVGAPYDAAVVEDGELVVRKVLSFKWTFDERIEDGWNAARAAGEATRLMENPELML